MDIKKSLNIAIATKGITTNELAAGISVSRQQIANWKRTGIISSPKLEDISKYFEMKVSELIALGE